MCGICGVVWTDPHRPVEPPLLEAMTARLAHRGPDGVGYHYEPGAALGHRRLSIIDVEGGAQPLSNEDGRVWATFNGEIYNFQPLRAELERGGHVFRTRSDTEVLVHLYEDLGPRLVERLRGMFALAIWDSRTRTLFLARDRLGKKPLVYRCDEEGLRFASELKSLMVDDGFRRDVDLAALDDYLTYQYVPHPRTIFQCARKLPPAHIGVWRDGALSIERYWRPAYAPVSSRGPREDAKAVRETLTEAVRLRMVSDVPLGAFLSGGVDSTIVVGIMQSLSSRPIQTFSIGFSVPEYDETEYARLAARRLGTEHHEFHVSPDAAAAAEDLAECYDEPFGDSSAIPTYYVARETRRHVKAALTGDGGDEVFLGYERYRAVRWGEAFDRLPGWLRRCVAADLWQRAPTPGLQKSRLRQAKRFLEVLGNSPTARYRQLVTVFSDARRASLYSPELARELERREPTPWIDAIYDELPDRDFLTRTGYVDLLTYLPGDILTKVDVASMAHGLECRCPFLDHELVELVGRMPVDRKLRWGRSKAILKEAFADLLPGPIARRRKMGFGAPLDRWLRGELRGMLEETLFSRDARDRGWFAPAAVRRLVDEHQSGRWDHSHRLWALLTLEAWARRRLDRR